MRNLEEARQKTEWAKIEWTYQPSLGWAWIDTCCIDKSSSAELTEAINSMFRWYQQAKICFVYLSDLRRSPTVNLSSAWSRNDLDDRIKRCYWFTRGWTLQELVAPKSIVFYDEIWIKRGTKMSLKTVISEVTGIDLAVLDDSDELVKIPVGRRMSWISKRNTTRTEDIAYCLFGIFDINMPFIYGEGAKAFLRLQTIIAQQVRDLSLFSWCAKMSASDNTPKQTYHGMFAPSHRYFSSCSHLRTVQDPLIQERHTYSVTNEGIGCKTPLCENPDEPGYLMNLYCQYDEVEMTGGRPGVLALRLVKTLNRFVRRHAEKHVIASHVHQNHLWPGPLKQIQIPGCVSASESLRLEKRYHKSFRFRIQCPSDVSVKLNGSLGYPEGEVKPWDVRPEMTHGWDSAGNTFLTGGYPMFMGMISPTLSSDTVDLSWSNCFRIMCSFTHITAETPSPNESILKPWVSLIAKDDKNLKFHDEGSQENLTSLVDGDSTNDIFETLNTMILRMQPYGPVVTSIRDLLQLAVEKGLRPSTSIILIPWTFKDYFQVQIESLSKELQKGVHKMDSGELALEKLNRLLVANSVLYQRKIAGSSADMRVPVGTRNAVPGKSLKLSLQQNEVEENGLIIHEVIVRLDPVVASTTLPVRELRRNRSIGRMNY